MGWTISHGTPTGAPTTRSYNWIGTVAENLANALTSRDWALLRPVFNRGSGDPFDISPDGARTTAALLRQAAESGLMTPETAKDARLLADAADRAATVGHLWQWS
ncbi:hypothetical protein OIC43_31000 [Streptomyces sp. NBC_00825]|uniref:DUF7739 domain-containing protein n=1 Tax=unclassified Streptomyces TaxID=2593676 RepID=UPI002ED1B899|nr:hypothetical protein OG832_12685 [Streptomyces sp. NBC_00826]WTH93143.1 hypothetical protein OIC43_31000 [Streptomyces sp. NBC_00825]WTI01875.1 hypothetical protein OHA23_30980 [Streptomyces sp. NBC_00822]